MTAGLPITVETGWPLPILWPNARPGHPVRLSMARKSARTEAFWATRNVIPVGWKHDGSRLKMTIEARPQVSRERDDDNLVAACKSIRDGIADGLNINDKLFDLQPVIWGGKHNRGGRLFITVAP